MVGISRGSNVILQATVPVTQFDAGEFAEEVAEAYNMDPTKTDKIAAGNVEIVGIRPSESDPNETDVNVNITMADIPVMGTRAFGRRPRPRQQAGRPSLLKRFGGRVMGIGFDSVLGGIFDGLLSGVFGG